MVSHECVAPLPSHSSLLAMSQFLGTRIAVLVDTSSAWGRRLIQGVLTYAKVHGPWDVWIEPRGQKESPRLPRGWNGDGIIARVSTKTIADKLSKFKVPIVNVSGIRIQGVRFPRVCTDNVKFAEVAVSHFVNRGLRSIAFIGLPGREYSLDRQRSVAQACEQFNCHFEVYHRAKNLKIESHWERERASIGLWLNRLPKPVGVITWGVRLGTDVIEEANHNNLKVPDEVAVLGEDDELLCEAVQPSLSGVVIPSEQIGIQSAIMLEQLMRGKRLKKNELALEPTGIVSRISTDVLAIDDPEIAEAVRFIRNRAHEPLRVNDVANALAISRRSLERRFQELLQRTVGEEIARVHLERAKLLLATTKMTVPLVAEASGYGSSEYLATVVKRHTGLTPRQYRKHCQGS